MRKPLKSSRTPLTTVLWPFSKSVPAPLTAPALSCIKSKTLRPFSGRLAISPDLTGLDVGYRSQGKQEDAQRNRAKTQLLHWLLPGKIVFEKCSRFLLPELC